MDNALADGKLSDWAMVQLSMGQVGCQYRGSLVCLACPWAARIARECDYDCLL